MLYDITTSTCRGKNSVLLLGSKKEKYSADSASVEEATAMKNLKSKASCALNYGNQVTVTQVISESTRIHF